jgi:hypothetical protein
MKLTTALASVLIASTALVSAAPVHNRDGVAADADHPATTKSATKQFNPTKKIHRIQKRSLPSADAAANPTVKPAVMPAAETPPEGAVDKPMPIDDWKWEDWEGTDVADWVDPWAYDPYYDPYTQPPSVQINIIEIEMESPEGRKFHGGEREHDEDEWDLPVRPRDIAEIFMGAGLGFLFGIVVAHLPFGRREKKTELPVFKQSEKGQYAAVPPATEL